MKVSLYVPKKSVGIVQFLRKELATAKNIKSKATRDSVSKALTRIINNIQTQDINKQGFAYFCEGNDLNLVPYDGIEKKYFCGKKLLLNPFKYMFEENRYLMIAMDTNHCTIGILHGKKISLLWDKEFYIPGKSKPGGQSQQRYARLREEQRKQMMKAVAAKLAELLKVKGEFQLSENEIKTKLFKRLRVKKIYDGVSSNSKENSKKKQVSKKR